MEFEYKIVRGRRFAEEGKNRAGRLPCMERLLPSASLPARRSILFRRPALVLSFLQKNIKNCLHFL